LWIDSACDIKMADSNWSVWHKKRMSSPRSSTRLGKAALAAQTAVPRLVVAMACTASLRSSPELAKFDPAYALLMVIGGAAGLAALGMVHFMLQQIIDHTQLQMLLERTKRAPNKNELLRKRSLVRFVLTQTNRVALVVTWFVIFWRVWEGWCWQLSCPPGRGSPVCEFQWNFPSLTFSCDAPYVGLTSGSGYTCSNNNTRVCPRELRDLTVYGVINSTAPWRYVNGDGFDSCRASCGFHACDATNVTTCANLHHDRTVTNYEQCMVDRPNLTIAFVAALSICIMLVQWMGLIDGHGWARWLEKRDKQHAADVLDQRAVLGIVARMAKVGVARGKTVEELEADLTEIPRARIERAVGSLSSGLVPILAKHHGSKTVLMSRLVQAPSPQHEEQNETYYTLQSMVERHVKVRGYTTSLAMVPRHTATAFAVSCGAVSDFFYRLFDVVVALALFAMLSLLSMLPLHWAQSLLLFNTNFWQVIAHGIRNSDFLESLWA